MDSRLARLASLLSCFSVACTDVGSASGDDPLDDALARTLGALDERARSETVPTHLEDPSGHAFAHFVDALDRTASRGAVTRIAVYGGSHTAADLYTGEIRAALQAGFGDAGHGFVMPVPPFENYWQSGIHFQPAEGWGSTEPAPKHMEEDTYGIAGMAFDADGPANAELVLDGARASRIAVLYLKQPLGGTLELAIDGRSVRIPTASDHQEAAVSIVATSDAHHTIDVNALGDGPVRMFGLTLEREGRGIVLDQLGLAGSKARHALLWRDDVWAPLFESRHPDLLVVSYGNNESDDHHLRDDEHVAHFDAALRRFRAHAPTASCLVLGPSDRLLPRGDGTYASPPLLTTLRDAQRASAFAQGCAFFDVMAWQGGPGAMQRWLDADPPLAREDRVHYTERAYRLLGETIVRELVEAVHRDRAARDAARP